MTRFEPNSSFRRRTKSVLLIGPVVAAALISLTASEAVALPFVGRVPFGPQRSAEAGISPIQFVQEDGTVLVRGVIECPAGEIAHITFELTQGSTVGTGEWTGECIADGHSRAANNTTWTAVAVPSSGASFVPGTGPAGASFTGTYSFQSGSGEWSFDQINLFPAEDAG